jgi:signal transduction histidine kinase
MTGDSPLPASLIAANLRRLAKERLYMASPPSDLKPLSDEDVLRLMHELQVKQIELQIQNEELLASQAQEKAAAQRYTELYDRAPVGYFTLNQTGAISQSNLAGASLLGTDRTRLPGKRFSGFVIEADQPVFSAFLQNVFAGDDQPNCEVTLRAAQMPRTVHINGMRSADGLECRIVVSDITQLRHNQVLLQELNDNLEARVAQRTMDLEHSVEQLRQSYGELAKSEAKATLSTLIASVFHELRTPISIGKMVVSALTDHARTAGKAESAGRLKRSDLENFVSQVSEGADLIHSNLERVAKMLDDFGHMAADQASAQRRSFDLVAVVEEVLHSLRPSLKRKPHRIEVDIPPGIAMDSQPGPLGQIVINLVNNAYLHAFEGRTDGVLTISAQPEGDAVQLRFSDNGVGMGPEQLARLFEPFFSTKIGGGGTGLGMTIVKNLVIEKLQGRIAVESTPGQGSCFVITLPRVLG